MPVVAQFGGDLLVAGHQTFPAVDHEDEQIGAGNRALALADDQIVERILAGAEQSAGIESSKRCPPDDRPRERVARRAGDRAPRSRGANRSCG